jgi:WD40 repeat protein
MPGGRLLHQVRPDYGGVLALVFSPDGKTLISAGADGVIHLWDVNTGKEKSQLRGHREEVTSLALSPSGRYLVSGGEDRTIRVWDLTAGKQVRQWEAHTRAVYALALHPGGRVLASGGEDDAVRLWDRATGKRLRSLRGHVGHVSSVAFSPDGKTLASAGGDQSVRTFPDGEWEITDHDVPTICLWDVETGKQLRTFGRRADRARLVAFAPSGKLLASADDKVAFWDPATGKEALAIPGHRAGVFSVALSPGGTTVASRATDRTVRLWDRRTGKELRRFSLRGRFIGTVVISPNGKTLLWHDDKSLCLLSLAGAEKPVTLPLPARVGHPVYSPDGRYLAAAGPKNMVFVWDMAARRLLRQFRAPGRWVRALAFSPDGATLAVADHDSRAYLLDAATGKLLHRLEGHRDWLSFVSFSPDGRTVVTGSSDGTARLWDVKTGQAAGVLAGPGQLLAGSFSPDGRMVAVAGSGDTAVRLWEVATGKVRARFEGHRDLVDAVAFSADGKTLASGGGDTSVLVWDTLGARGSRRRTAPLAAEKLREGWEALASQDAHEAYGAIGLLSRYPQQAAAFLGRRLEAVPRADPGRVAGLVEQLGSEKFRVREQACRELEGLAEVAVPALKKSLRGQPPLEVRRRVERLLERLDRRKLHPERLRALRALEVLEYAGTAEVRKVLHRLSSGAAEGWLTQQAKASLDRLTRQGERRP